MKRLKCTKTGLWLRPLITVPIISALAATAAQGQTGQPDVQTLDTIVVTATKRSEAITSVPFSISAFEGDDLNRQQARSLSSFLTQVPGVAPIDFQGEGTNIVMRGISTAVDGEGNGTTSAVYFGESLVGGNLRGGNGSPNFRPVDIERVEVLRGPQGSLYGAGSLSGAVRFVPRAPNLTHTRGGGSASIWDKADGGGTGGAIDGYLSTPLAQEKAALAVVGYYERDTGFVYNKRLQERIGDSTIVGGRAALRLKPVSNADITATVAYQRRKADGTHDYNPLLPSYQAERFREAQDRKVLLADVVAKIGLGAVELTSVSTLFKDKAERLGIEYDRSLHLYPKFERLSQELRLASTAEGPFRWLVGGYVERFQTNGGYAIVDSATERLRPRGELAGVVSDVEQLQYAVFGEIAVDFAEKLTATLGGRYADYSIEDQSIRLVVDPALPGDGFLNALPPVNSPSNTRFNARLDDSAFTPRLNLAYKPDQDQTYYLQAARGFRVGGLSPVVSDFCALAGKGGPFKSDSLWSYEGGAKIAAFDRRVRFSGAAHYSVWKDIPVFLGDLSCFQFYTANAARARSYGVEAEVTARVSPDLTVAATFSYTNTKLTDVTGAAGAGQVGEALVGAPKWLANFSFDYERPLSSRVVGFVSGNANYVGRYSNGLSCDFNGFAAFLALPSELKPVPGLNGCYNSFGFNPPQFIPDPGSGDYVTANLQVGARIDGVQVYVFARNLLNNKTRTFINYLGQDGFLNYTRVTPRMVGLAVQTQF